jgi:thymidylate synthase
LYNPIYKKNDLILGSGKSAIITGWTDKRQIAKHLDSSEYAVVGNLFDPDIGLDYLIANVLANPQVNSLKLYCDPKNQLSIESLTPLWKLTYRGYIEKLDYYAIQDSCRGRVSKKFTVEDLEIFRQISSQWVCSVNTLKESLCFNVFNTRQARVIKLTTTVKEILPPGKLYNHCL